MEEYLKALEQVFTEYRQDLENYEKKQRPMEGILGFGHSLKDDSCHDRFDEHLQQAVRTICESKPSAEAAERLVRKLLFREADQTWPLAAQWMLMAAERHSLPLIPFLEGGAAAEILREYESLYKPWNRLPVQKDICKALRERKKSSGGRENV